MTAQHIAVIIRPAASPTDRHILIAVMRNQHPAIPRIAPAVIIFYAGGLRIHVIEWVAIGSHADGEHLLPDVVVHPVIERGRRAKSFFRQQSCRCVLHRRRVIALRMEGNLTQRELTSLIGTTASVICRLEDADYGGHSLTMLSRIAAALQQRVEISFVPLGKQRQAA